MPRPPGARGRLWLLSLAVAAAACGGASARSDPAEQPSAADVLVYEHEIDGNVDIYTVPASGGTPRRLTRHPGVDIHARWMPDGGKIVYTTERGGHAQLWEISASGEAPRPVRTSDATESQPDPSPDGQRLAFISGANGTDRLMLMDLRTGVTHELVRHGESTIISNPHWSPDGSRIAFSSNWKIGHHIYYIELPGREVHPVVGGCEPRFTRDGRRLVYVNRREDPTSRLVERDLETGEERVLVGWPALNYDAAYSPDGAEIAFASNITGEWAIYRQRLSDGRAWRVTFGGGPARYPDYRPRAASGGG